MKSEVSRVRADKTELLPDHPVFHFSLEKPEARLLTISDYALPLLGYERRKFPKRLEIAGIPGRWARLDDEAHFAYREVRYCRIDGTGWGWWLYWRARDFCRYWWSAFFIRLILAAKVWGWAEIEFGQRASWKCFKWPGKARVK
jgi:hypothetical protein